jgi:hypothetical protein
LSWSNPTGQRFELIVSIDEGYLFNVRQRVVNLGTAPVAVTPFGLVSRASKSSDESSWTSHVGRSASLAPRRITRSIGKRLTRIAPASPATAAAAGLASPTNIG